MYLNPAQLWKQHPLRDILLLTTPPCCPLRSAHAMTPIQRKQNRVKTERKNGQQMFHQFLGPLQSIGLSKIFTPLTYKEKL